MDGIRFFLAVGAALLMLVSGNTADAKDINKSGLYKTGKSSGSFQANSHTSKGYKNKDVSWHNSNGTGHSNTTTTYEPSKKYLYSLVIVLHGGGGNAENAVSKTGFSLKNNQ
jgi:predicted peptidase